MRLAIVPLEASVGGRLWDLDDPHVLKNLRARSRSVVESRIVKGSSGVPAEDFCSRPTITAGHRSPEPIGGVAQSTADRSELPTGDVRSASTDRGVGRTRSVRSAAADRGDIPAGDIAISPAY